MKSRITSRVRLVVLGCVMYTILWYTQDRTRVLFDRTQDERLRPGQGNISDESGEFQQKTSTNVRLECKIPPQGYNVLFIMADDMRATPAVYHVNGVPASPTPITPNLDRLASKSLVLKNAHVQYALCGPSRASILTSRRPDTTKVYNNRNYWRDSGGNFTTIPQYFRKNGYRSIGIGKIFHPRSSSNNHDPDSWSEPHHMPSYVDIKLYNDQGCAPKSYLMTDYKVVTRKDRRTVPRLVDELALGELKNRLPDLAKGFRRRGEKFFVGFGISRPHMNLLCPEEDFAKYDLETAEQYLAVKEWQTPEVRQGCRIAGAANVSGRTNVPDMQVRHMRRAYLACISHVDSIVGHALKELEKHGLLDSTIISFVADHGLHFGENNHYGKVMTYGASTHVPMMLRVPGCTDHGVESDTVVETVDLFPTLARMAGLPTLHKCPTDSGTVQTCSEGVDLTRLISNIESDSLPNVALSQTSYNRSQNMLYSIVTPRYRFTAPYDVKSEKWLFASDNATELFDFKTDPFESVNLAKSPDYSAVQQRLMLLLKSKVNGDGNLERIKE